MGSNPTGDAILQAQNGCELFTKDLLDKFLNSRASGTSPKTIKLYHLALDSFIGYPITPEGHWFDRLKQRAEVTSHGCLHKLRHTAALQYLRGAKDSFLLQLFLRHESLEMSRRYTRGLKAEEAIEAHRNGASPVEGLGLG